MIAGLAPGPRANRHPSSVCRASLVILTCAALAGPGSPPGQAQAPAPSPLQAAAAEAPRPRVRLIATGGTIANHAAARLTADDLAKLVPQADRYARVETEQFSNLASSQLSLDQWLALARRINALLAGEPDLSGVVVTSGTDTLEELAYFLHLTVRSDRPVVVVGSMRRPEAVGYEGAANLLAALRVAADPQSRDRGSLVVLNDEIQSAREATKTDAQRLQTFQTRGYGLLGVVDTDRVVYYRNPVKRHSARSEFDVSDLTTLPRVDVLLTYQGAPGDLVRAAVDGGARGIVLATAAGATSGTQPEGVRYAVDRKVIVVRTTRTGSGRIMGARAAGPTDDARESNGDARTVSQTIAGEDLSPVKARILLMLALTRSSEPQEIQRMFLEY